MQSCDTRSPLPDTRSSLLDRSPESVRNELASDEPYLRPCGGGAAGAGGNIAIALRLDASQHDDIALHRVDGAKHRIDMAHARCAGALLGVDNTRHRIDGVFHRLDEPLH